MPAPIKWKPDFELVNLENPEGEPWLSASPDGRFSLLFFETPAGLPVHTDLEERIYSAAGVEQSAIGTTFSAATNEHQVAGAYLPDGRRVYVWTEEPTAGGGNLEDVFAEVRFGNNIVDVARFLVTGGAGRQHDPIVAANSNGFAVAVVDDSVAGGQLIVKFYNIAGTPINTVLAPNAPQTVGLGNHDQFRNVEIASLANGNYVIVWDNGGNQNVFARVYSSGGVAQSGVIDVETGAPGASFADVTALADGRFVVTYLEYSAGDVFGRIFSANGTPDGAGFAIGSGAANAVDNQVQTAALHDGRFVTVWKTIAGDIAGQVMFADGTADGAEFTVNTVTAGDQSRPTIATLADGRFAVSWESGAGANPETIITTIFDPRETGLFTSASGLNDDWIGTGFGDTVFMGVGNDRMSAAAGNDTIHGEAGTDTILGEAGNDQLFGGSDNDALDGGAGNDALQGGLGNDAMTGGNGNDTFFINAPGDTIIESVGSASGTADKVASSNLSIDLAAFANVENAQIVGAATLSLTGSAGANVLIGGSGGNAINGLGGADILAGGKGRDIMSGGTGLDDFDFNALNEMGKTGATRDRILDFVHNQDDIDLRTIDAKSGVAGNQAFKFIGTQAFHDVKGELRFFKQNLSGTANDKTVVAGDVNGDGKADFQIELKGLIGLTKGDFFL